MPMIPVTICGSFRRDNSGLKKTHQRLKDVGCEVLSPRSVEIEDQINGFVYMKGQRLISPGEIEDEHLDSITRSKFVWLHAPDGYVGLSGALEIGFARAHGIPVYSLTKPADTIISEMVEVVPNIEEALAMNRATPTTLRAFQEYYKEIAVERNYESENPRDALLLMVEEVGELANAIRSNMKMRRDGSQRGNVDEELADVFIYVAHLANIMKIDLAKAVVAKETHNHWRFSRAQKT